MLGKLIAIGSMLDIMNPFEKLGANSEALVPIVEYLVNGQCVLSRVFPGRVFINKDR